MKETPGVEWVGVGDREADIYELFELVSQQGVSFLVRSFHNRRVCEDTKLWDAVDREGSAGSVKVFLKGKDKRERDAELEVRFRIEVFHKILKSGRRSEDRRLGRLERCLSIDMITAWRLMYLTMLGRETPEVPAELLFNEQEVEVLKQLKYGVEYAANKDKGISLCEVVQVIATLGGFVKDKKREPGAEVMWRGIRRLADILIGVSLTKNMTKADYG